MLSDQTSNLSSVILDERLIGTLAFYLLSCVVLYDKGTDSNSSSNPSANLCFTLGSREGAGVAMNHKLPSFVFAPI